MKKLIALPLIAATALGLSACAKHETTNETVTVNETSTNVEATDLNATDNAAEAVDNASNTADALTNG